MRLLVILILSFVFYLVATLFIGFARRSNPRRKRPEESGGEMVKDPICDTYVPKSRAIQRRLNGQSVYFCSQDCANAYDQKTADSQG